MEKLGVEVTRRHYSDRFENLTNIAPVIRTMCDDVQQYLLPGHCAVVTIREPKNLLLAELSRRNRVCIVYKPSVSVSHRELQLTKVRRRISVGCRVAVASALQVGLKDAVYDEDVIERSGCSLNCRCMLVRRDRGQQIEQLVVGPGFLREEGLDCVHGGSKGLVGGGFSV